jgi:lipooligosaccharide transport system permease protein
VSTLSAPLALRSFEYWLFQYKRTWRGSVVSTVLFPVLFLASMGLGLGSLVDSSASRGVDGLPYLVFLAPGLLAATAMQTAIGESTYPVMAAVKWRRTYQAAAATPLRPADLFHGHLLFTALRLLLNCGAFLAVMAIFGAAQSLWALAALPVAILTGLAFAVPVEAWAIKVAKDTSFALIFRFGMIPMFLFSGTFFPVSRLPLPLEWLAYATPLWHGVDLCREFTLGHVHVLRALGHVVYLLVFVVGGLLWAQRTYTARLLK